jgi:hypothetical protein
MTGEGDLHRPFFRSLLPGMKCSEFTNSAMKAIIGPQQAGQGLISHL